MMTSPSSAETTPTTVFLGVAVAKGPILNDHHGYLPSMVTLTSNPIPAATCWCMFVAAGGVRGLKNPRRA